MADEKAKIIVDGDISPLRQKLREAAGEMKSFGAEGKASLEGLASPLAALQNKFIAISALLAGGAVFKAAVSAAAEFTEQSLDLGRALGISATEASTLINTLEDIGVSQDEYVGAAQKLSRQIKVNEEDLQAMGLQTRNAAGELRPLKDLMMDAVGVLNGYKAGTDRAIAAQVLFGKGFELTSKLAKLNSEAVKENEELQKRLGAIVGQENVEAWEAYDQAMDQSGITLKAFRTTIGNAVMPVLTKFGEWFVAAGPYVIKFTKIVMETFLGIVDVLRIVKQAFVSVGSDIGAVFAAASRAIRGDFAGAATILRERIADAAKETQRLKDLWMGTGDSFLGKYRAQAKATPAPAPDGGSNADTDKDKDKNKNKPVKAAKPQYSDAEWANLEAEHLKRTLDEINRYMIEHQEAANAAVAAADKKLLEETNAIHMLRLEGARAAGLARIEELEQQAAHELELGAITHEQYLARMRQFNADRLAIEQQFIDAKRAIALEDPDNNLVELERLEQEKLEIKRRYAQQEADLARQQATQAQELNREISSSMSSLWDKMINSMMQGTFTWKNLLQSVFTEIAGIFGGMIKKMFVDWITQQIQMMIYGKTAALSEITALAGKAGAGGVASMAAAPFPINLGAPAFGAAMSAAAMAYAPMAAAKGGYDVPKGLNPVTRLHEEEMVLPKHLANAVRDMASAGAGSGQGEGGGTRIINAIDPAFVGDYMQSPAGEKVILNVIRANSGAVKQIVV